MKILRSLLLATSLSIPSVLHAKDENGLRVEARKTIVEKNDDRSVGYNAKIDRTLAVKISVKNISMKPFETGKVEWIMLIERWGSDKIERFKGTEPLPALKVGEEIDLTVGESKVAGYKAWDGNYQDKLEGWQVTIKHDGQPTMVLDSGSTFERANKSAKDIGGKKKKHD